VKDDAKLRLDRRLVGRRGFLGSEEFARELEELEDVAAKAVVVDAPTPRRREPSPQGA